MIIKKIIYIARTKIMDEDEGEAHDATTRNVAGMIPIYIYIYLMIL